MGFEADITSIKEGFDVIEAKADVEAKAAATKELKSILYKIHKATDEETIDVALDRLAKGAIKHDFSADKVALLQKEVDRKLAKLKAGNKEEEPEAKTTEVEADLEEAKPIEEEKLEKPYGKHDPAIGDTCAYCGKKFGAGGCTDSAEYEYCSQEHMKKGPRMFEASEDDLKKTEAEGEEKPLEYEGGVTQKEISEYLDELRQSGVTNMFGAGAYVEREFGLNKREARAAVVHWMKNFGKNESILKEEYVPKQDELEVEWECGCSAEYNKSVRGWVVDMFCEEHDPTI